MLYRATGRLQTKKSGFVERGEITALSWLGPDQVQKLIDLGHVTHLSAPPLAELPGWTRRAARMKEVGISMADEFLEHDVEGLAAALNVKPATVERWKTEVVGLLTVLPRDRG